MFQASERLKVSCKEDIPTPSLVVDLNQVTHNVRAMADYAKTHGLALRPHTKTHKSLTMASLQLEHGATGVCVAKLGEANVMAEIADDLLLGYPIVDNYRADRIAQLANSKKIRLAVDTMQAVECISAAAAAAKSTIGILIDIDVGYHRTGAQDPESALALAKAVESQSALRLDGLFCFPGHIAGPPDQQDAELAAMDRILLQVIDLWREHGLAATIVSGGSTPTSRTSHQVTALNEIRPGSYIYSDWNCVSGNWYQLNDCAASVLATVVSDAVPGKVVIDAGSKTLTQDRHFLQPDTGGFGHVVEYPQARIIHLTEEHGEVDITACDQRPKVGQRIHVIPNHICPCVNLQNSFWLQHGPDDFECLPVEARGCVV